MCIKCKDKSCKGSCQNSGNNSSSGNGSNSFGGNGFGSNGSNGGNGTNGSNGFGGNGTNGNNGAAGVNGANGTGGATGGAGGTGLRGPRGFQGPAGPPGPAGVGSGTPGQQGQQGNPGQQGQQGNPGNNGAPGLTGPAPTITIGVVTQGPTPAVAVTGTNPYALNFTLPKGDPGTPGLAGGPGLPGIQGNMGSNSVLYKKGDGAVAGTVGVGGAATYTAVTQIAISHTTINGYGGVAGTINGGLQWVSGIVKNSIIQLIDAQNSANFGIYKVMGSGTSGNTHIYVVTLLHANGSIPAANTEISVSYNIPGQDAIPNNTGGSSTATGAGAGLFPVGGIIPWAGAVGVAIPVGWLLCDGQIVSTVTYGDLFSVIGTEYNINTVPTNTFTVPNLIDKIPYGGTAGNVGNEVGDNAIVGTVTGTAAVTLTGTAAVVLTGTTSVTVTGTTSVSIGIANLPEHTHTLTGLTASTTSAGSHSHSYKMDGDGASGSSFSQGGNVNQGTSDHSGGIYADGAHTHGITVTGGTLSNTGAAGTTTATGSISGTGNGSISGTGSGPISGTGAGTITGTASGDNRQKGITMRYIIKY